MIRAAVRWLGPLGSARSAPASAWAAPRWRRS